MNGCAASRRVLRCCLHRSSLQRMPMRPRLSASRRPVATPQASRARAATSPSSSCRATTRAICRTASSMSSRVRRCRKSSTRTLPTATTSSSCSRISSSRPATPRPSTSVSRTTPRALARWLMTTHRSSAARVRCKATSTWRRSAATTSTRAIRALKRPCACCLTSCCTAGRPRCIFSMATGNRVARCWGAMDRTGRSCSTPAGRLNTATGGSTTAMALSPPSPTSSSTARSIFI